jgi:hypothetical protein
MRSLCNSISRYRPEQPLTPGQRAIFQKTGCFPQSSHKGNDGPGFRKPKARFAPKESR